MIVFAAVDGRQQENKERSQKDIFGRRRLDKITVFSMEDWEKTTIEEVKIRWGNRRREIEEEEERKKEIDEKIEIKNKKKEERRKRVIRERRCFVCGIFGHMAHYYRNKGEKKGLTQMPLNKFEVLKNRVMERGEGSGKEVGKNRKEILKEEKTKKKKRKIKVEKKEKVREEREIEIRGFSGGEILKERYPLVWRKVQYYECRGLGHKRSDYREKTKEVEKKELEKKQEVEKDKIEEDKKKEIVKDKIVKDKIEKETKEDKKKEKDKREIVEEKKEKKKKRNSKKKKKIERRECCGNYLSQRTNDLTNE